MIGQEPPPLDDQRALHPNLDKHSSAENGFICTVKSQPLDNQWPPPFANVGCTILTGLAKSVSKRNDNAGTRVADSLS